jgi:predicted Zn-dependent peptidase
VRRCQSCRSSRAGARQTATLLAELWSIGRSFNDEIADQRRVSAVTAETVTRIARMYVDPARLVVVFVGAPRK